MAANQREITALDLGGASPADTQMDFRVKFLTGNCVFRRDSRAIEVRCVLQFLLRE